MRDKNKFYEILFDKQKTELSTTEILGQSSQALIDLGSIFVETLFENDIEKKSENLRKIGLMIKDCTLVMKVLEGKEKRKTTDKIYLGQVELLNKFITLYEDLIEDLESKLE